ncbi:MAG: polysaccharide deacetylase family protein [bacterium]
MELYILMYHKILKNKSQIVHDYSVDLETFKSHIKYLVTQKYQPICINNLKDISREIITHNKKKLVMVTFDDGYDDNYSYAMPVLEGYGIPGTFFITTNWIDTKGMMSWKEIGYLQKKGMAIESHTTSHRYLDDLTEIEVVRELSKAKNKIKQETGNDSLYFSCPGGRINKTVKKIATQLNIRGIFTSIPGVNIVRYNEEKRTKKEGRISSDKNNFNIYKRLCINKNCDLEEFKKKLTKADNGYLFNRGLYQFKILLRSCLGNRRYHNIWKMIKIGE